MVQSVGCFLKKKSCPGGLETACFLIWIRISACMDIVIWTSMSSKVSLLYLTVQTLFRHTIKPENNRRTTVLVRPKSSQSSVLFLQTVCASKPNRAMDIPGLKEWVPQTGMVCILQPNCLPSQNLVHPRLLMHSENSLWAVLCFEPRLGFAWGNALPFKAGQGYMEHHHKQNRWWDTSAWVWPWSFLFFL